MLTKQTNIDKIEIVGEYKAVQVREATQVVDGGVPFGSPQYRRYVVQAGDDYSSLPDEVQAICKAVHTPELVAAYRDSIAASTPDQPNPSLNHPSN
jgi:hypothetical protein